MIQPGAESSYPSSLRAFAKALLVDWSERPLQSAAVAAGGLLLGSLLPVIAWATKSVVDAIAVPPVSLPSLAPEILAIGVCTLALRLVPLWLSHLTAAIQRQTELRVIGDVTLGLNSQQTLTAFESPSLHDTVRLALMEGRSAPVQALEVLGTTLQYVATVLGFLAGILTIGPGIAAIILLLAVPGVIVELRASKSQSILHYNSAGLERKQILMLHHLLDPSVAKELRVFGAEGWLRRQALATQRLINSLEREWEVRTVRRKAATQAAAAAGSVLAVTVLVVRASQGNSTAGDVVLGLAAVAAIQSSLVAVGSTAGETIRVGALFSRVVAASTLSPVSPASLARRTAGSGPTPKREEPLRPGAGGVAINFTDVWFRYQEDDPWTLRGCSFSLLCGEVNALVGLNGAGKSTVVKLMLGFYRPQRGIISWDSTPLDELDLSRVRHLTTAVFQDSGEYEMSLRENVGFGQAVDDAALESALTRAGLGEVLQTLPQGLDSILSRTVASDLGETAGSWEPSGGQWQRIAIARMLTRPHPGLVILDEATRALDAYGEAAMYNAVRRAYEGCTQVIVTHRLSHTRAAKQVIVLAEGRVVQEGDPDVLLSQEGLYASLFDVQAQGYLDLPVTEVARRA